MSELPSAGDGPGTRTGFLWRTVKAGTIAAGIMLSAAAGTYLTLFLAIRGKEIVVPDLVDKTKEEAEQAAREKRLGLEIVATRPDPRIGAGRVIEQEPAAGSRTRPDRTVRVTVSAGQQTVEIPAFIGSPIRKAQLELKRLGLRAGSLANAPSADAPVDQVIAQRPAAGSRRQVGEAVDLLVSRGSPERVYVMPLLSGVAYDRAATILGDAGVRAAVARREARDGSPAGIVLDQQPPEGHPVREKETVRLVVSQ